LGISVDGVWSHLAFAKDRNLRFPLLADFEPKGKVARTYHVYRAKDGTAGASRRQQDASWNTGATGSDETASRN
jgi:peroxiredoxin